MRLKKETFVNLGTSKVTISVLAWGNRGLEVCNLYSRTINDHNLSDSEWISTLGKELKSLCSDHKLKGSVKVVLPSDKLLSKTIRVPKVEEIKQRNVVTYELSKKMPFPLDKLIWDYQIIDDDGIEQEILAFAVKPNFINDLCGLLLQSNLFPTHICPGTILENEILSQSESLSQYSELMLINLGARSLNLLFSNPHGYLARSINFGGNNFTTALSEAFGLPFARAEELKINNSLGKLKLEQEDPASNVLKTVANNFYTRIGQEISRSLVTYKRLKKGKYPQIIILTGNVAKDSNLVEFLGNAQDIPVTLFNASEHLIAKSPGIEDGEADLNYELSEVLGFAQLTHPGRKKTSLINLLPKSLLRTIEFKKKKKWLLLSALFFTLSPLPALFVNIKSEKEMELKLNTLAKRLSNKETEISFLKEKKLMLNLYQTTNIIGYNYIEKYRHKSQQLNIQSSLINDIQNVILGGDINNTWIDSIKFHDVPENQPITTSSKTSTKNTGVTIEGRYLVSLMDESSRKTDTNDRREKLIELNSIIQENLTNRFMQLPMVKKLTKKVFSTDGKGDLFGRCYAHFEIHAELDTIK